MEHYLAMKRNEPHTTITVKVIIKIKSSQTDKRIPLD